MIPNEQHLDAMPIGTMLVNKHCYAILTRITKDKCTYYLMYRIPPRRAQMIGVRNIPQEFLKSYKLKKGEYRV